MNPGRRFWVLLVTLPAIASGVGSYPLVERQWGPAVQAIRKAATIGDPIARERAFRETLRGALIEGNEEIRRKALEFLSRQTGWLDLRPDAEILEQWDRISAGHDGEGLLGDSEWFHMTRDGRIELYRKAIVDESAKLRVGRSVSRYLAIESAATGGLDELRPLVVSYYAKLPPEFQRDAPLPRLLATLDLRSGSPEEDNPGGVGARHLSAIEDGQLATRMASDEAFREAAPQLARDACVRNPFTHTQNEECKIVKNVYERQERFQGALAGQKAGSHAVARKVEIGPARREDWIRRLKEIARGY